MRAAGFFSRPLAVGMEPNWEGANRLSDPLSFGFVKALRKDGSRAQAGFGWTSGTLLSPLCMAGQGASMGHTCTPTAEKKTT